ncbi:alpha/beta fold hydrolase [Stenotrophobium rhamnosiphilum]|uniref:Cholesterol oxidase n=1 Tax=Stenotrophobium rhamnosiphilum TaxID=2029166 RepID=A0A2T5MJW4_9GAMM|nr:alpha/beta fold hydrolase [Stenotrophobium rhamnosiphilum]PTU32854.1 hypothetical protein CJD38_01710 [Stenotrophobium rhamnosiphilum]
MSDWVQTPSAGTTRWISREFSELIQNLSTDSDHISGKTPDFDVLIVGSGYGASIAAAELAGCTSNGRRLNIAVLERGREYLPGAFPSKMADLPTHIRGGLGALGRAGEGLFDIRGGADVSAIIANGLGGGSLINAGVMEIPDAAVFNQRWPKSLRDENLRAMYYFKAKRLLGGTVNGVNNTISQHAAVSTSGLQKTQALKLLENRQSESGNSKNFREAAITVAMSERLTSGGVRLNACKLCGDCATGCNYGAKESLDTNLLVSAFVAGAKLYCGATVLRIEPTEFDGWRVLVTHTDVSRRLAEGAARWITTSKLILAAGTLGSSEILLRSQQHCPEKLLFSTQLGKRFSANGDNLTLGYDHGDANAVADEDVHPVVRMVGSTITGIVDAEIKAKAPHASHNMVIEELAVPGPLRRLFEESVTFADTLESLVTVDDLDHKDGHPDDDPYAVSARKIKRTSLFASMGDDGAAGTLRLVDAIGANDGDGFLSISWPEAKRHPLFEAQAQQIAEFSKSANRDGRTIANPLLNLVPAALKSFIDDARGPVLTVHPLGGCAMADTAADGVVNSFGQVFKRDGDLFSGLVVLDGSIIPSALGTNPALTIAAMSLRAIQKHKADWGFTEPAGKGAAVELGPRPTLPNPEVIGQTLGQAPTKTRAEFQERLSGAAPFIGANGKADEYWIELTLAYPDVTLENLFRSKNAQGSLSDAVLKLGVGDDGLESLLRIYRKSDFNGDQWTRLKCGDLLPEERPEEFDALADIYPLTGSLTIFKREATTSWQRIRRGFVSWMFSRGFRDSYQAAVTWIKQRCGGYLPTGPGICARVSGAFQIASHAGEVRRLDYALKLGASRPSTNKDKPKLDLKLEGKEIFGAKRITYARPSNLWRQLQELTLTKFPVEVIERQRPVLSLDLRFLATRQAPLFRFTAQSNQLNALMDSMSLGAYLLRMLFTIHLWNARAPELPKERVVNRLPGVLPGLPAPEIHTLDVDTLNGAPVQIRLTRYRSQASIDQVESNANPPVLMIHGYSASGTTFAHPSLKPSLASYLASDGRDVWVLDLRSSCGLPYALQPWSFEQIALADIPAAVDFVFWRTGQKPLDIVAHCMSSAMLSMALLSANQTANDVMQPCGQDNVDRFRAERMAMPSRIRKVALSQIGPVMAMSPANVFRAYILSYFQQILGSMSYAFRPKADDGLLLNLLDRLFATLPYPDDELIKENPIRPWAKREYLGTRHRMDALYGMTFKLSNLSDETLDHLDDFFGPISFETVAQVIHFSRYQTITNRAGRNRFVSNDMLHDIWKFPTLSIHGDQNGLADLATIYRMDDALSNAGCTFEKYVVPGHGHQDCLIGVGAPKVFDKLKSFFDEGSKPSANAIPKDIATTPGLGPMLTVASVGEDAGQVMIGMGGPPDLGTPQYICMLPMMKNDGVWSRDQTVLDKLGASEVVPFPSIIMRPFDASNSDKDWYTYRVPGWAKEYQVRYLAVLLIYSRMMPLGSKSAVYQSIIELCASMKEGPSGLPPGVVLIEQAVDQRVGLRLALGSCQYAPGILDRSLADEAWQRLNARLVRENPEGPRTELIILAGDQVYVDPSAGLFDPVRAYDRYRNPYDVWLSNLNAKASMQRVPVATMLDDHEIHDNCEPVCSPPSNGKPNKAGWVPVELALAKAAFAKQESDCNEGIKSFLMFQRATAPDGEKLPEQISKDTSLCFEFERNGVAIFMLDTRSKRHRRTASSKEPTCMFDAEDMNELKAWLITNKNRPKLIVEPALLFPRHRQSVSALLANGEADLSASASLRSDSWDGYPDSCYELLSFIADQQITQTIFLSGDEHLGIFSSATLHGPNAKAPVTIWTIHAPGLYTPYPFANATSSDFMANETFEFKRGDNAGKYQCKVESKFFDASAFAMIALEQEPESKLWQLTCEIDGPVGKATERVIVKIGTTRL